MEQGPKDASVLYNDILTKNIGAALSTYCNIQGLRVC